MGYEQTFLFKIFICAILLVQGNLILPFLYLFRLLISLSFSRSAFDPLSNCNIFHFISFSLELAGLCRDIRFWSAIYCFLY